MSSLCHNQLVGSSKIANIRTRSEDHSGWANQFNKFQGFLNGFYYLWPRSQA